MINPNKYFSDMYFDITGNRIENLNLNTFTEVISKLSIQDIVLESNTDNWKVFLFSTKNVYNRHYGGVHNSISNSELNKIFELTTMGYTGEYISDFVYSKYNFDGDMHTLDAYTFSIEDVKKYPNFERLFYKLLKTYFDNEKDSRKLKDTILIDHNYDLFFKEVLTKKHSGYHIMGFANVVFEYNIDVRPFLDELTKNVDTDIYSVCLALTLMTNENKLSGKTMSPIYTHFDIAYERLTDNLSEEELLNYFENFSDLKKITSAEMFEKIIENSDYFNENWHYGIIYINGNTNRGYITSPKSIHVIENYMPPQFVENNIAQLSNETRSAIHDIVAPKYENNPDWDNALFMITPDEFI